MIRIVRRVVCVLVPLAAALASAAAATGPVSPDMPFVMTRLGLDLRVDYGRSTVGGTATLHVRNLSDRPAAVVPLLLGRLMTVSRITGAGGRAIPFVQRPAVFEDDTLRRVNAIAITPARPVSPGDSLVVVVHYDGTLVGYTETGSLYIKDHVSRDFTILREDAFAFPTLGVPSWTVNRTATREPFAFTARITVPKGVVVATGGASPERTRHDSLVTWTYRGTEPVPFLNITIAPYAILERAGARIFYFPQDSTGAHMVDRAIASALDRYVRWYGPLAREARLVVMEIPEGFGSQASLTAGIIQTADAFRDRAQLRQVYHELSHLWNVPDTDTPSARWNEGLASFLQWRMAAELDGWNDWDTQLDRTAQTLLRRCEPVRCDTVAFAAYGKAGLTDLSYPAGLLMFYALYQTLGPDAFDRTYRDFFQRHRERGATAEEMVAAFRGAGETTDQVLTEWWSTPRWRARLGAGEPVRQIVEGYGRP